MHIRIIIHNIVFRKISYFVVQTSSRHSLDDVSLSKNPDFGEEIGVKVLIKDENRQKFLKTAEK